MSDRERLFEVAVRIRGFWVVRSTTMREGIAIIEAQRLSHDYRRARAVRVGGQGLGKREVVAEYKDGQRFDASAEYHASA